VGGEHIAPLRPPLPETLRRYIKTEDFNRRIERLGRRAQCPPSDLRKEIVDFLALGTEGARGDLGDDWRGILDFYSYRGGTNSKETKDGG
jgi:hypothetical protein